MATVHNLTAGTGGSGAEGQYDGSYCYYATSNGGGGVLVYGNGPSAGNGTFYLKA